MCYVQLLLSEGTCLLLSHYCKIFELISNCFSNYKQFFLVILKNRAHDYCQLIGQVRFLTKNKN